jgi:plasmid stabilization system protein ParE
VITISLSETAINCLDRGYWFYETREQGSGEYFKDTLLGEIEGLRVTAGIHRLIHGHRRLISRVFPFAIYYKFENSAVEILTVVDCRRNPDWIREQLKD